MSRPIKISAAILNVRLHPHSMEIYAAYFLEIYKRRVIAKVHGDRYAVISLLDESKCSEGSIGGIITSFTQINSDGTWFNIENMQEATKDQVSSISIPGNLFPNAASFYFYFDLKSHKMYIQSYSKGKTLTPATALRVLNGFSEDVNILKIFKEAKINIVQDKTKLEEMFSIDKISEIKLIIAKPNSDIFADDFEQKIEAHLSETHSRQIAVTYSADRGESITPNRDIREISEVALENGSVEVVGRDQTGAVRLSSSNYPRIIQDKFDQDQISEKEAFNRLVMRKR